MVPPSKFQVKDVQGEQVPVYVIVLIFPEQTGEVNVKSATGIGNMVILRDMESRQPLAFVTTRAAV